jgi:hypothetical protein
MPQAPMLPPEQMASAQANAGINPVNFLIAAADMHGQGQLSQKLPQGQDPLKLAETTRPKAPRRMRVVK